MTGPSIGWILWKNRKEISDFVGWRILGGVGLHQLMKLRAGRTVKIGNFISELKAFFELILHKPSAVVDCSGHASYFYRRRTDKYKKKRYLTMSLFRNISIFAGTFLFIHSR
jgi:hypothetical protein